MAALIYLILIGSLCVIQINAEAAYFGHLAARGELATASRSPIVSWRNVMMLATDATHTTRYPVMRNNAVCRRIPIEKFR
ncbi:hypothetical protein [Bradyrhizobium sp. 27S5]|uniref:hypothetical protein n=1 Tax=Bradyrhizobium sp. 27S5 TaxID=3139728 RepID=UPI0030D1FDE6